MEIIFSEEFEVCLRAWADRQACVTKLVEDMHRICKDLLRGTASGKQRSIIAALTNLPLSLFRRFHAEDAGPRCCVGGSSPRARISRA